MKWHLALIIAVLALVPPTFAQNIDDSWTRQLGSVEQVEAAIPADLDEMDTLAYRWIAFETLHKAVQARIGARAMRNQWTPAEKAALDRYREARKAVNQDVEDRYGDDDGAYRDRRFLARGDLAFRRAIVNQFAPATMAAYAPRLQESVGTADRIRMQGVKSDVFGFVALLTGLAFIYLTVFSLIDRARGDSVDVVPDGNRVLLRYTRGRIGPGAALSFYPLYFNLALLALTLCVPLIFLFVASENSGLWEWLDENVPFPEAAYRVAKQPDFWINAGVVVLALPWWLLGVANFRRGGKQSIAVSGDGVMAGGETYDAAGIEDVYVWSKFPVDDETGAFIFIGGNNMASRGIMSGFLFRMAIGHSLNLIRRQLERVRFQVCIDHGGKRRVLAKKLPAGRAHTLCSELGNVAQGLDWGGGDAHPDDSAFRR